MHSVAATIPHALENTAAASRATGLDVASDRSGPANAFERRRAQLGMAIQEHGCNKEPAAGADVHFLEQAPQPRLPCSCVAAMAMAMAMEHQRYDLEDTIRGRHSTRKFLPTPVPRSLLMESLSLAQCAPSNSNIQPWHLFIAEGVRRDRLREALLAECRRAPPVVPVLPKEFQHYREELGAQVYGAMGIKREDKQGRAVAVMRNWEFFGAPVVAIICLHKDLGRADAMSVGMYVQTLLLALTARGLGSCCEVSLAAYPDVIRKELNISSELVILCGVAIGYTDDDFSANHLHVGRAPVEHNVAILDSD